MTEQDKRALEEGYLESFKSFSDKELRAAIHRYTDENDFYPPRPSQILKYIQKSAEDRYRRDLVNRWTCNMCHQKVSSIMTGGMCPDCEGLPPVEPSNVVLPAPPGKRDYKMESRIMCQQCGKIGLCIKEPADNGKWQCRHCYTGLTGQEIAKKLGILSKKASKEGMPLNRHNDAKQKEILYQQLAELKDTLDDIPF